MKLFKNLTIRKLTKKLKALKKYREHNQVNDETLQKEVTLYLKLAEVYLALQHHKKHPFAFVAYKECLRAAAGLDDAKAQYDLGRLLLDEAIYRDELENQELLANIYNQRQRDNYFEEALVCFKSAEKLGYFLAKRWHGLAYINGWGVEIDKEKGFEMVVASIDEENSWDKVPQIFADIGLNKPEFFAALGKHRVKRS
ncbi:MAG: hypothetical protein CMF38_00835 [Legionellaceae bacterium]|nr:hypothetical protein [Legionellaceae bacterium]HCA89684.1 hypothetical protein [Legionellales bacterium]|tara:strand:- start:311 stop:904 length:594 start_codon:yes stop_codon:yes gene_type:complete